MKSRYMRMLMYSRVMKSPRFGLMGIILALILLGGVMVAMDKKESKNDGIYRCFACYASHSVFKIQEGGLICHKCGVDNYKNINESLKLKHNTRESLDQSS